MIHDCLPVPALNGMAADASAACGRCRPSLGACTGCHPGEALARHLRIAFQPILAAQRGGWSVFGYEALVRGAGGEPAGLVLQALRSAADPHVVDLACRLAGLREAAALGLNRSGALLSLNVLPNATINPETCLGATLAAARRLGFAPANLLFEITEVEQVRDMGRLRETVALQRAHGVKIALDDFGAGYAGLGLLVDVQPDIVKLDMHLLRGIDGDPVRARIVAAVARACRGLGIDVIAEGVETEGELAALGDMGIRRFQGYLLARPGLGCLPAVAPVPFATGARAARLRPGPPAARAAEAGGLAAA